MAGTLMEQYYAPHTYQNRLRTTDIDLMLQASHHYLITRAPMVRITETLTATPHMAVMRLEWGNEHRNAALEFDDPVEPMLSTLGDGRYWIAKSGTGELLLHGSAWAYAALLDGAYSQLSRHQVLYVGKAYGRPTPDGTTTRNAPVRLEAHSKLQRIYEDHPGPGHDIFVTPLVVDDGLWRSDDFIHDDDQGPDLDLVLELVRPGGEQTRVALAEQALIAYFEPEYNELSVDWSASTAPAGEMQRTGLRVFTVTLMAWEGLAEYYSTKRPNAAHAHHIRWVVGIDEASQPAYSTDGPFEGMNAAAVTTQLTLVENSHRVFRMFGPSLPKRSPWETSLPSEDALSGYD